MSLRATHVAKCLDKKLLIFGFEIPDLLVIFFLLAVLNFVFGQTNLKVPFVWCPPILLATVLRMSKRGKPDNYLVHWIRFHIRPRSLSAFPSPTDDSAPPRRHKLSLGGNPTRRQSR